MHTLIFVTSAAYEKNIRDEYYITHIVIRQDVKYVNRASYVDPRE